MSPIEQQVEQTPEPILQIEVGPHLQRVFVPLRSDREAVHLRDVGAIAFQLKGRAPHQAVEFELSNSALPANRRALGHIFEFSPFGFTQEWQRIAIPITRKLASSFPEATDLVIRPLDSSPAVVFLKDLFLVPRPPGSQAWETIAVPLVQLDIRTLDDFSTLVLDDYEGIGPRIARVVRKGEMPRSAGGSALRGKTPAGQRGYFLVSDFDSGRLNQLQGSFSSFHRAPSRARVDLKGQTERGRSGKSLRVDYTKNREGFCGFWVHLFATGESPESRAHFDATGFRYLSFWIKGARGGEDVTVQLADDKWEQKEDSVPIAAVSEVLAGGIETDWKEVLIPLDSTRPYGLDFSRLASITFNIRRVGSGTIYIDDLAFKTSREVRLPERQAAPNSEFKRRLERATWIWDPTSYLLDPSKRRDMFRYAREDGFNTLFVQMRCRYETQNGKPVCRLEHEAEFRSFLRDAHAHDLRVHALDGYAYHVLPYWRPRVLAQVQAVLRYNARMPAEERFDGIHHDNEPYVIPGFTYSERIREQLLVDFLDLTAECQKLIQQTQPGLVYGIDVPFWYEARDEDFQPVGEVTWQGVRKPASFHAIDIADLVVVMDYRTAVYGADGSVMQAYKEVEYASRQGKQILLALETDSLPEQTSFDFAMNAKNPSPASAAAENGSCILLDQVAETLLIYGPMPAPQCETWRSEFSGLPARVRLVFAQRTVLVPASRLSFARSKRVDLFGAIEELCEEFREDRGFAGVAVHHYESLRRLP